MASTVVPGDIAFEDSYVLGLHVTPYALTLQMDLVLTPEHPSYSPPKSNEWACFKRGTIRIEGFRRIQWYATGTAPARDASGETDWGCLDEFKTENGKWRLAGDWGTIDLEGGHLTLAIES
jgi:hypothetical protein